MSWLVLVYDNDHEIGLEEFPPMSLHGPYRSDARAEEEVQRVTKRAEQTGRDLRASVEWIAPGPVVLRDLFDWTSR